MLRYYCYLRVSLLIFLAISMVGCGSSETVETDLQKSKTSTKPARAIDEYRLLSTKEELISAFGVEETNTIYEAIKLLSKGRSSFREKQEFYLAKDQLNEGLKLLEPFLCGEQVGEFKKLEYGEHDFNSISESALKAIIVRTYTLWILSENTKEIFPLDCLWQSSAFTETRNELIDGFHSWTAPEKIFDTEEFDWFRNPEEY